MILTGYLRNRSRKRYCLTQIVRFSLRTDGLLRYFSTSISINFADWTQKEAPRRHLKTGKGIIKVSAGSVKYTLRSSLAVVLCNRTPACPFHPPTHLSFSGMPASIPAANLPSLAARESYRWESNVVFYPSGMQPTTSPPPNPTSSCLPINVNCKTAVFQFQVSWQA